MVVFQHGEPLKEEYRRFNVRQAPAGDDCAALQELLGRRASQESWPKPDLILLDGGKGQLNSVSETLRSTAMAGVPLVALAKNPDHLFLEGSSQPVPLSADNAMLYLLQRIRDEGHRFAVSGHRLRRNRNSIHSLLEDIPGVGPARRKVLLGHFGSAKKLKQASIEQLLKIPGINSSLATTIHHSLRGEQ